MQLLQKNGTLSLLFAAMLKLINTAVLDELLR
jgi:hypothetical protein